VAFTLHLRVAARPLSAQVFYSGRVWNLIILKCSLIQSNLPTTVGLLCWLLEEVVFFYSPFLNNIFNGFTMGIWIANAKPVSNTIATATAPPQFAPLNSNYYFLKIFWTEVLQLQFSMYCSYFASMYIASYTFYQSSSIGLPSLISGNSPLRVVDLKKPRRVNGKCGWCHPGTLGLYGAL